LVKVQGSQDCPATVSGEGSALDQDGNEVSDLLGILIYSEAFGDAPLHIPSNKRPATAVLGFPVGWRTTTPALKAIDVAGLIG